MLKSNWIGNLTGIYNQKRIGKVYQQKVGHEDYLMWLAVLQKARNGLAYCIPEPLACYRLSTHSLSATKPRRGLAMADLPSAFGAVLPEILLSVRHLPVQRRGEKEMTMKGMYQMAALGCCAWWSASALAQSCQPNLLANPGFEEGLMACAGRTGRRRCTAAVAVCVMTMQMPRSTAPSVRCCGLRPGRRSISASGSRPMAYAGKAATAAPGFICRASMRRGAFWKAAIRQG